MPPRRRGRAPRRGGSRASGRRRAATASPSLARRSAASSCRCSGERRAEGPRSSSRPGPRARPDGTVEAGASLNPPPRWRSEMAVSELLRGPETADEQEALDAYSATVSRVAERLLPAVVSLRVAPRAGARPQGGGSAVVIDRSGLLVTSAHVVEGAQRGVATFADGTSHEVEVAGSDPLSDLALVRAQGAGVEP